MRFNFIVKMFFFVVGVIMFIVGLITQNIWTTCYGFFLLFASSELHICDIGIRLRKLEKVKQ